MKIETAVPAGVRVGAACSSALTLTLLLTLLLLMSNSGSLAVAGPDGQAGAGGAAGKGSGASAPAGLTPDSPGPPRVFKCDPPRLKDGEQLLEVDLYLLKWRERGALSSATKAAAKGPVWKDLGAMHFYGPAGRFGAPGRCVIESRFKADKAHLVWFHRDRVVVEAKPTVRTGKLLKAVDSTILDARGKAHEVPRIEPIQAPETLIPSVMRRSLSATLADLDRDGLRAMAGRFQGLTVPSGASAAELRRLLLKARMIVGLRKLETMLFKKGILNEKKVRPQTVNLGVSSPTEAVGKASRELEKAVRQELWWRFRLDYVFQLHALGLGAEDSPKAAWTPGRLDGSVGRLVTRQDVPEGPARVIWYRFPGHDPEKQTLELLKAPKGWVTRVFKPGRGSDGALLFILVPNKAGGRIEINWQRNDATGATVSLMRPPALNPPY